MGEPAGPRHVLQGQHLARLGVLQAQEPGAREMEVVRLHGLSHLVQVQRAIVLKIQGLRLDAAQHRCAAALCPVAMGTLPGDVFVAALAVAEQGEKISLGAGGDEQGRFLAEHFPRQPFETVDRGIFAVNVIANFRIGHGLAHGGGGLGDRVAAQVDSFHVAAIHGGRMITVAMLGV